MWRTWDEILDLFLLSERLGFDSAFLTDHFLSDWDGEGGEVLEAWTMLAALAREVPRIRIGTFVSSMTHRYPALLAKQAVTVDHLSGGRLILGVGAGWNEREHQAFGMRFPPPGERVDLFGEALEAIARLEREERSSYQGQHVVLDDTPFLPAPINGHIPVLVGSRGRRMLSHVARYADLWDLAKSSPSEIRRLASIVEEECDRIGRDPTEIVWMHEERAVEVDPGGDLRRRVELLAPLGVSYFLVNAWPKTSPELIERVGSVLDDLR
jgi:alkanesulfonate monooxygenase SsuD/methylene tetrahydromethanopterin reductase-like flavin-dependent oxidoreductase (luciferase family)